MRSLQRVRKPTATYGFTLIELLVVIAIIGLLASVVLSAVSTARLKGTDAALESEAQQLRTVMEQEYADTGSYANVKAGGGWWYLDAACNSALGTYAAQVNKICATIIGLESGCTTSTATIKIGCLYFNRLSSANESKDKYTIMVYLPGESATTPNTYLCMGSSGATSIGQQGSWMNPGCYNNP